MQIRFTALSDVPETDRAAMYVDAVWVQITYQELESSEALPEELPRVKIDDPSDLIGGKRQFASGEEIFLTMKHP